MERGEGDYSGFGYYTDSGQFVEAPRKQALRLGIPYNLRISIIWVVFFAIIGIVIQSINASKFIFVDFFAGNYIEWFKSFGSFTNLVIYPTGLDIFKAIMEHWYYFFYTGGLIALIWELVSWIIHGELVFRKHEKSREVQSYQQPIVVRQFIEPAKKASHTTPRSTPKKNLTEVELLLVKGENLVLQGKKYEARSLYEDIRKKYKPHEDEGKKLYRRILDFHAQIK